MRLKFPPSTASPKKPSKARADTGKRETGNAPMMMKSALSGFPFFVSRSPFVPMHLIVGLGNPGPEYSRTRHNIGWMILDELARRYEIKFDKKQSHAKVGGGFIGGNKVL